MALKTEEEVKEFLENIGVEYRFSCFHEKNAEGCHLLGDYLEAYKQDFEAAKKVYQSNCDERKYARSCFKVGNYDFLGKGCVKDLSSSLKYYKTACDLSYPEGCLHQGVMLTVPNGPDSVGTDFVEGLKSLEKGCSLGNAMACYYASGIHITGAEGVPKDLKKASEMSLKACEGKNIYACMNLSHMYRKGDGVEKDEKKAEMFKEKAREIREENKTFSIGLQQHT
ncbi:cytochrome c oxidase assembly factor 7 homolog [Uloborus diversus]|uniref:cytochrome c oxidase assembly factor 7 homolog n=1 Tax=Uloborus diversus TaxID=327109 RepID=UPI002409D71C|nr:cytochrome c oxidase assembly factor 7 homolog [Uloborus diversus]